jgi:hypothetical protein
MRLLIQPIKGLKLKDECATFDAQRGERDARDQCIRRRHPRARLQHIGDLPYALLYGPGPCLLNPSHGRATGFWGLVMAKPLRGTPGSVLTCATTTRNRVLVFKMTTYTCSLPWFVRLEVPYAILVHLLSLGPFGGFPPYLWCRFPTRRACALPNWTVSASRFPMRVNYPEECSCR